MNHETLSGKGLKALNVLLNNLKHPNLTTKTKGHLVDACVGSILSYGCEVWGFGKNKEIERIHLKFCKLVLNVKSSTSNAGVYGELGRNSLYIIKNWSYNVKQLLDNYGLSHVFRDPHLKNHSTFYLEFKSRVIGTFQQQWYVNDENSYSLSWYNYFKTCFEQEQYLNELLPKYRVALSKLRLASNKLKIVTGRYDANRVNVYVDFVF